MATTETIYDKLAKVQAELKVPKSNYNSFARYNYRSAEDILEAVKPLLKKHGLTLMLSDHVEAVGDRNYVVAHAHLFGGTDPSVGKQESEAIGHIRADAFAREDHDKKGMDGSQITGAASSYARKYALNGLFAIDDTKDADTNEHRSQVSEEAPSEPAKPSVGTAPRQAAPNAGDKITDLQRKRMYALMGNRGIPAESMHDFLVEDMGVEDTKAISRTKAAEIINYLENMEPLNSGGETADEAAA